MGLQEGYGGCLSRLTMMMTMVMNSYPLGAGTGHGYGSMASMSIGVY
jgi:hypothetical protein